MDKETIINNLLTSYGKYGITRMELEPFITSLTVCINGKLFLKQMLKHDIL